MDHNVMTVAERERLAYVSGDTTLAQTLAAIDDAAAELEEAHERITELEDAQ